jgi:hypothetical protein
MIEKHQDSPEVNKVPVELKFGSVVRLEGEEPDLTFLVLKPISDKKIEVNEIISDAEGEELLGQMSSTRSQPAELIGEWSLQKAERGWFHAWADEKGEVSPRMTANVKKHFHEYSQLPSVMYNGKTGEELSAELARWTNS